MSWLDDLGLGEPEGYNKWCCGRRVEPDDDTPSYTSGLCINLCCVEWTCLCGEKEGGYGPAGCCCELGGPNPLVIDGRAYHRRSRARVKRRR